MRSLSFASILIAILLTGCQSLKPRHLTPASDDCKSLHTKAHNSQLHTANCTLPTPFSSPTFEKALFRASLDIREHHLTGLLFIKKIPLIHRARNDNDAGYRIVFSNEFGMTYFDLEIGSNTFQVKNCFRPMNKKALWKILKTDFRLLLATEKVSDQVKLFVQDETNYLVCQNKQRNLDRWDLFTSAGDTLVEVRGKSNMADQTNITFTGYQQEFPLQITIFNSFIKLKLSLSLLSVN
ncbi:MAG: hypothetical protein HQ542_08790 [Bacteroidia bacterium]|nr:hypothetical protein [Bacteroidia bacterium]